MAGQKQPIDLVIAKGSKHLTKEEIAKRRATEIQPCTDDISPPDYLTKKQKDEFRKISEQLQKLKIMGETDVDTLARYIVSRDMYVKITKKLRSIDIMHAPLGFDVLSKAQERYFKQVRASATDLGLTISSRCKLVVPQAPEAPKQNKFNRFKKGADPS